jgi:hypothetical protein
LASQLLEHSRQVLDNEPENLEELHLLAAQLTSALRDVLRVATSRGRRPVPPRHP